MTQKVPALPDLELRVVVGVEGRGGGGGGAGGGTMVSVQKMFLISEPDCSQ